MIKVFLQFKTAEKLFVGRLLIHKQRILFEYDKDFLETGLALSPFNLPLKAKAQTANNHPFNGLHGLFADSLPDGWGLLLMDRFFRQQGINIRQLTPLDRLSFIGATGMGALVYEPDYSVEFSPQALDLSELAKQSHLIYQGSQEQVFPALIRAGGSPAGARPKALLAIKGEHFISGESHIPEGYQGWLVKFHAKAQQEGIVEAIYARLAAAAGLIMPETRLLDTDSGRYFAVRRFDRVGDDRLHVHSLAGLVNADFRVSDFDYESFFKVVALLTKSSEDCVQAYRQMVFNLLACNRDDHSKNFAFVMDAFGGWRLSPVYDLTFNYGFNGEHSMAVAGYGKDVPFRVFFELGAAVDLDAEAVKAIFSEVFESLSLWESLCLELGLDKIHRDEIQAVFDELFTQYKGILHV